MTPPRNAYKRQRQQARTRRHEGKRAEKRRGYHARHRRRAQR